MQIIHGTAGVVALKLVLAIFVSSFLAGQSASAQTFYLYHKYPTCDAPKVLKRIVKLFNKADRMTWHRGIEMNYISRPHDHNRYGFADSAISRRFCHGYAHLTNGKRHKVYYVIEQGMGFAGNDYNVDFCLTKYDPWRVYDGYCRTVRPQ